MDLLKSLLIGVPVFILCIIAAALAAWGFFAAVINFPKTTILTLFLLFSVGLGYNVLEASRG